MSKTRSQLIDLILEAKQEYPEQLGHIDGLPTMRKQDLKSVWKMIENFKGTVVDSTSVEGVSGETEQEIDVEDSPPLSNSLDGVVKEIEFVDEDEDEEEGVSGETEEEEKEEEEEGVASPCNVSGETEKVKDDEDEVDPEAFIQSLERTVRDGGSLLKSSKGTKLKKSGKKKAEKVGCAVKRENTKAPELSPELRRQQREIEKEAKVLLNEFKDATTSLLKTPKHLINKYGSLTELEARDLTDDWNDVREELEDKLELLFTEVEPGETFYKYMNNLVRRQMNRVQRVLE